MKNIWRRNTKTKLFYQHERSENRMKAQYRSKSLAEADRLTFGKEYDVLTLETKQGKIGVVEKIEIENDEGKRAWHAVEKFILSAEAAAEMKAAAAGAAKIALQNATPENVIPEKIKAYIGIDLAAGQDMTAAVDTKALLESARKSFREGILHYGA